MKPLRNTVLPIVALIGVLLLATSVYLFCDAFKVYQNQKRCVTKEEFNKLLEARLKAIKFDEETKTATPGAHDNE